MRQILVNRIGGYLACQEFTRLVTAFYKGERQEKKLAVTALLWVLAALGEGARLARHHPFGRLAKLTGWPFGAQRCCASTTLVESG